MRSGVLELSPFEKKASSGLRSEICLLPTNAMAGPPSTVARVRRGSELDPLEKKARRWPKSEVWRFRRFLRVLPCGSAEFEYVSSTVFLNAFESTEERCVSFERALSGR